MGKFAGIGGCGEGEAVERWSEDSTVGMDRGKGKLPLMFCSSTGGDPENWVWDNREVVKSSGRDGSVYLGWWLGYSWRWEEQGKMVSGIYMRHG